MSFVQRKIDVAITLGDTANGNPNVFSQTKATGPSNTITLSGLRVSAKILKAGFPQIGMAQISIYGMDKPTMDQISTLGIKVQLSPRNTVTVFAGDDSGMTIVFVGTILLAWGDFSAEPDVAFHIQAQTAYGIANIPYNPSSFQGSVDAVTILQGLATAANLNFENNGVSGVKISNAYLYGSPLDQIKKIKQTGSNQFRVGIDDGTLFIVKKGEPRGGLVPLISSDTGMVAYPNYNSLGITLRTIFNPSIGFMKKIQVKSSLGGGKDNTGANGTWVVYGLDHTLESQVPGGQWFSTIQASRFGEPVPVHT
jgi:hypothetical protein